MEAMTVYTEQHKLCIKKNIYIYCEQYFFKNWIFNIFSFLKKVRLPLKCFEALRGSHGLIPRTPPYLYCRRQTGTGGTYQKGHLLHRAREVGLFLFLSLRRNVTVYLLVCNAIRCEYKHLSSSAPPPPPPPIHPGLRGAQALSPPSARHIWPPVSCCCWSGGPVERERERGR